MKRAPRKRVNGGLRVAVIVVLLATAIFFVPSSARLTPRPGARFEDVAHRIALATEGAREAVPRFVPGDFLTWQAQAAEDLPAWLRRADRCPADFGGRILVAYEDAPIEARAVPARGEALGAFLGDVTEGVEVEVWPCRGAPRVFSAAELAETPQRYLLVPRAVDVALFDSSVGAVLLHGVAAVVITVGARKVAGVYQP